VTALTVNTEWVAGKARNDVEVDVIDVLTGGLAVRKKEVDALAAKPSRPQRGRGANRSREEPLRALVVELRKPRRMPFRQNESVAFVHRLQVHDHEEYLVLEDALRSCSPRTIPQKTQSLTSTKPRAP
jgi:hypothetical protein